MADFLASQHNGAPFKLHFIRHHRVSNVKGQQVMSEDISDSMADCIINEATGYHVVDTDASVVFYNIDNTGMPFYASLVGITLRRPTT